VAEEQVERAAGTDRGAEDLVGEAGLTRICRRTGRSHQVIDHMTCKASSSALLRIRHQLGLLCLCSSPASLPMHTQTARHRDELPAGIPSIFRKVSRYGNDWMVD
jgi:hypothetical protein